MSAKAVAYPVQDRNSMTCTTKTGQPKKLRKKLDRTAEKNTSNGTLAKNKATTTEETDFFLALTLHPTFLGSPYKQTMHHTEQRLHP
jgi:Tfp pilus assembly protein PilF